ncbi:hypothetical protein N658DRAFT_203465 [Parathielavia hyrcaniae]|uniref:Uncharacterized protein n=1 Tax=Parathielavia hyrcaniae TaxID=113614 RepID=A0AAN6PYL4_9PEZI|nr:hypothetical protein N658DRAFT_203465 [Parathielavia hyrcaniae]
MPRRQGLARLQNDFFASRRPDRAFSSSRAHRQPKPTTRCNAPYIRASRVSGHAASCDGASTGPHASCPTALPTSQRCVVPARSPREGAWHGSTVASVGSCPRCHSRMSFHADHLFAVLLW